MLKFKGLLLTTLAISGIAPALVAQETQKKELTARELFYTAVAAPAKPAAAAKPAPKPAAPPPQTARVERKKPVAPTTPTAPLTPSAAPDGTPVVLAAARHTAPPPAQGSPLGLRYTITKLVDGKMLEVPPDTEFKAGDRIRITVVPNASGYLYIVNQGSSGTWKPLFPSADIEDGNNRVEGFRDYVMPPKSRMVFDEQAGTERLFVILSREPEKDLESMIYSLQGPKAQPAAEPSAPPQPAKTMVAAVIPNETVGRMRQVYARDLVIEKVDDSTPGDRREQAVYVVNPSGSADSRVVADISLVHK